jgi:hypothetical protein
VYFQFVCGDYEVLFLNNSLSYGFRFARVFSLYKDQAMCTNALKSTFNIVLGSISKKGVAKANGNTCNI